MAALVAARAASRDLLLAAAQEFDVPAGFVLGRRVAGVRLAGGSRLLCRGRWAHAADARHGGLGRGLDAHEAPAITDAQWNARAGVRLLAYYLARYQGDKARTLAAYLQGMGSVDSVGVLRSSQPYIDNILALEVIFSR